MFVRWLFGQREIGQEGFFDVLGDSSTGGRGFLVTKRPLHRQASHHRAIASFFQQTLSYFVQVVGQHS